MAEPVIMYLLIPSGVYYHEPLGLFSTQELAETARVRAEQSSDGHHVLEIHPLWVDRWQLGAFSRLTMTMGQTFGTPGQTYTPAPVVDTEGLS